MSINVCNVTIQHIHVKKTICYFKKNHRVGGKETENGQFQSEMNVRTNEKKGTPPIQCPHFLAAWTKLMLLFSKSLFKYRGNFSSLSNIKKI